MRVTERVREWRIWAATLLLAACATVAPPDVCAQAARTHKDVVIRDSRRQGPGARSLHASRRGRAGSWSSGCTAARGGPARRRSRRWRSSRTASRWPASTSGSPPTRVFRRRSTTSRRRSGFCAPRRPSTAIARIGLRSPGPRRAATLRCSSASPTARRSSKGRSAATLNQSSDVAAIIDYYGASNLTTILAQSTPFGLNMRRPALELLLGALPDADAAPRASWQPRRPRRPQRSAAPDLSRRSGSADADQSVA